MGHLSCAMKDYQQAITIDPHYALAYFNAANIYFFNKQFSQVCIWFFTHMLPSYTQSFRKALFVPLEDLH